MTYLNVLQAGKPYIYDIKTVVWPLPLHQIWHLLWEALTIISIAFLWVFFLGGFIVLSGPRFVCEIPRFTLTQLLDTGCTAVLAKSEVSPSDVALHYWIFSHASGPSQWECCSKGEEVRSLKEPSKTGFMAWQNEHPLSQRSRDHQINRSILNQYYYDGYYSYFELIQNLI